MSIPRPVRTLVAAVALVGTACGAAAVRGPASSAPGAAKPPSVALPPALSTADRLEDIERAHVIRVIGEENGHVERAATRLGIPRSTLYQKLKAFGYKRI